MEQVKARTVGSTAAVTEHDLKEASTVADIEEDDRLLRSVFIPAEAGGSLGLHLSRTPWDPYPWVSGVLPGSCAEKAGVRIGDCVLEANGEDLLGLKIIEIAKRVRSDKDRSTKPGVSLLLWNSGFEKNNLNPQSLSRFASCLQGIAGLLECPVCLEVIRPPSWQCYHGHLICSGCRSRSSKCPICRVLLGRGRCIVADKLFNFLVQTLGQHDADKHPPGPNPSANTPSSGDPKSSNGQQINAPLLAPPNNVVQQPLHRRLHRHYKQSLKLKANSSTPPTTPPQQPPPGVATVKMATLYCCPSGQPCDKMKNQHDILIHLQKSHQTSVVQYYVAPGEPVRVHLAAEKASCVTCVVLVRGDDENNNSCPRPNRGNCRFQELFFVAKFRCMESAGQALYWLWHLGGQEEAGRYRVTLAEEGGSAGSSWTGSPVSLRQNCKDVLKSKQFFKMDYGAQGMLVTIEE
ncbi:hypothetical protein pipiens_004280 [Culex pipiens pipiens]|uniref:Uncharacterized protein n=1 Tax=Culex pipiens pipiens TaxID=38569 RepID=A0ABD1CKH4_CULPP